MFELGEKIRKRRKYLKKNQGEVAEKMPVSKSQISKWENENTYPSMSDFVRLCGAMDIHPADLIAGRIEEDLSNDRGKKTGIALVVVLAVVILCLGINLYATICRLNGMGPSRKYEINSLYSKLTEDGEMEVRQMIRPEDETVWVDIVTYEKDGIISDYQLKEIVFLGDEIETGHKVQLDDDGKRLVVYVRYQVGNHSQSLYVEIKPQK